MEETKITFYDVEHGACTHISTPNGTQILVDIGGCDNFSPSYWMANILRLQTLDALVLTHPHEDHYHDLQNLTNYGLSPRVLSRNRSAFPVQKTDANKHCHDLIDTVNNMSARYTHPVLPTNDPFLSTVNGGVKWTNFLPDTADTTQDDPNTFSGIYVLEYGGVRVVLTGDNNKEILAKMINKPEVAAAIKNADFLLAPHHGRTTDYCDEFFKLVNPKAVIISDKPIEHNSQEQSASEYNNGRGIQLNGETRYVLTTRTDGNIELKINNFGQYSFNNWKFNK